MASRPRPATATSAFWQLAVIRRADWAPPVRLRARAPPAERLRAETVPGLRGNAESAVRLRRWVHEVPPRNAEVGELLDACAHLFSDYVMASTRRRVGLPG
ncbi:hypothetical protein [Streptomyces zhihengii]